jgi:hypothetical protein
MKYIVVSTIKQKVNGYGKQITKDALNAIEIKVDTLLDKLCHQFNGSSKRIDATMVNYFKI